MEKLKFKNGEVEVITDIDEIVRLTLDNCKKNTSEQKKRIEKYLRDNKPDKCWQLRTIRPQIAEFA